MLTFKKKYSGGQEINRGGGGQKQKLGGQHPPAPPLATRLDGSTVRYVGTVLFNFCKEVRYAGTVRLFCNGTGTVRWYGAPFLKSYGYGTLVRCLN